MAALAAWRWAGAMMENDNEAFGQEHGAKKTHQKSKMGIDRPTNQPITNQPTDKAGCKVALHLTKNVLDQRLKTAFEFNNLRMFKP